MSDLNLPSKTILNAVSAIAFFWFLGVLIRCFQGDTFPTYGNLHDFFIPLNSAYALATGEVLHETFRSPFGIIYHYLNYWAFSVAGYFPDLFSPLDSVLLSSVIFDIFIVALFFLIRFGQERDHRLPFWMLLIVLTFTFQARDIDVLHAQMPNWYGLHNNHLWAVLILQIAGLIPWGTKREGTWNAVYLAAIMSICISVSFNYKISFFVGSGFVCLAPMLFFSRTQLLAYIVTGLSVSSLIFMGVMATGYSYGGYYEDIMQAVAAKSSGGVFSDINILMVGGAIILLQIVRGNLNWSAITSISTSNSVQDSVGTITKHLNFRTLAFDTIIMFATALASAGDFNHPAFFYLLVIFIVGFWNAGENNATFRSRGGIITHLVAMIVFLTVFFNISSLDRVAQNSISSNKQNGNADYSETRASIVTNNGLLSFNVFFGASMAKINSTGVYVKSSDWKDAAITMSYATATRNRLMLPVFENWNVKYIKGINEVSSRLTNLGLGLGSDTKIQTIGFVNPYPFVLGTPFLQKNFHWVHIGTTIRESDIDEYLNTMLDADIIILPVAATDPVAQTRINCAFYKWNSLQSEQFEIVDVLEENLLLAKANLVPKFGDQDFSRLDMTSVADFCGF